MATGLATYPDASVVCGPTERDPQKKTNVTNPRLLLEVTSDSTEEFDRSDKLEHYKQVSSLEVVVLVSHREPRVDVWSRSPGSSEWSMNTATKGQKAALGTLGCALDVDAIWQASVEPA
jgi:Uma2 family endonuclease